MNVLIIGAGSIGMRHANILQDMGLEVTFFSKRSDLTFAKINSLSSINLDKFSYIIIANESSKHYLTLKKILKNVKDKIILIENPLFVKKKHFQLNISENKCFVGYNLRFHPLIQKLKNTLLNEEIINIELNCSQFLPDWNPWRDYRHTYSAKICLGGGVLKDISHEIDLLYFFLNNGTIKFYSTKYLKLSNLEIETNDYYRASGLFNTTFFSISLDYISKIPRRNIIVYTNNKTIYADLLSGELKVSSDINEEKYSFNTDLNLTYEKMHKDILFNNGIVSCKYHTGKEITQWFQD